MPAFYPVGSFVSYRQNGICKIVNITTQKFDRVPKTYYILQSVYGDTTQIFVPADTPDLDTHMRPILRRDQIDCIISESEKGSLPWHNDSRQRHEMYSSIMAGGDRVQILQMIKQLSLHRTEVEKAGRKFYAIDENMLNRASKVITEDFAFALGLPKEQVISYILNQIQK